MAIRFVITLLFSLAPAAGWASDAVAAGQPMNRCASCHFANLGEVPRPEGLADWQHSAHARHLVGCDRCHGGDPTSYVPAEAHRGVLGASNPASPVHASNLVATCGACHAADAQAFARGAHRTALAADDPRAPTCLTCHGAMRAERLSPPGVEARCAACHARGSHGGYSAALRLTVEAIDRQRQRADEIEAQTERLTDRSARLAQLGMIRDVRALLSEAVANVHAFELQPANERADAARRGLDAIAGMVKPSAGR